MDRVTGKRKAIDPDVAARLSAAGAKRARSRAKAESDERALRDEVVQALADGASVRVVADLARLAPVTVAKWKSGR
jgi:hypothetical protein